MNHSRAEVLVVRGNAETMRWRKPALSESSFRKILSIVGLFVLLLLVAYSFSGHCLFPIHFGISESGFCSVSTWDPVKSEFGSISLLVGTLATSFFALVISVVFSVPISIFLGSILHRELRLPSFKSMIELLAGSLR